jgi:hypothetical protein
MAEEHKSRGMDTSNDRVNPVEVQSYLGGVSYPMSKDDLVEVAKDQGATEPIMEVLEQLPDKEYNSPADVTHEVNEALKESDQTT